MAHMPLPATCPASPVVSHQGDPFVTVEEPVLTVTVTQSPQSRRVHSRVMRSKGLDKYDVLCPPLGHHTEQLRCRKVPCPPVQPSPSPGWSLAFSFPSAVSWESGQAGSRIHTLGMRRPGFGDEGVRTLRTGQPGRD